MTKKERERARAEVDRAFDEGFDEGYRHAWREIQSGAAEPEAPWRIPANRDTSGG